jgi:hypothetical protein
VLYYFKSEITNKIITLQTTPIKRQNFLHFYGFVCDFIDFFGGFDVKIIEHTVASYESTDFTKKKLTV